jgi:hypothetical protein
MIVVPVLATDLIDQLEAIYKQPIFAPGMDHEDLLFKAGQWDVVNMLIQSLKTKKQKEGTP